MKNVTFKNDFTAAKEQFTGMVGERSFFYDNTYFIREVLDDGTLVKLFVAPPGFGASFNLAMLNAFLSMHSTADFSRCAIAANNKKEFFLRGKSCTEEQYTYKAHYQKYCVIYLSFKDMNMTDFRSSLALKMSELYTQFAKALPRQSQDADYQSIINMSACDFQLSRALVNLTQLLYEQDSEKPWILIDDVDWPIAEAICCGCQESVGKLLCSLLNRAMKGNEYLGNAVMTAKSPVMYTGFFSGFNNVTNICVREGRYKPYFGFSSSSLSLLDKKMMSLVGGYSQDGVSDVNPGLLLDRVHQQQTVSEHYQKLLEFYFMNISAQSQQEILSKLEYLMKVGQTQLQLTLRFLSPFAGTLENMMSFDDLLIRGGCVNYVQEKRVNRVLTAQVTVPNLSQISRLNALYEKLKGIKSEAVCEGSVSLSR